MNRQNFNLIGEESVDDPVALNEEFPDVLPVDLGDNATYSGELTKVVCGSEDTIREQLSIPGGIPSDEETDGIQVIQCLFRPGYLSH